MCVCVLKCVVIFLIGDFVLWLVHKVLHGIMYLVDYDLFDITFPFIFVLVKWLILFSFCLRKRRND